MNSAACGSARAEGVATRQRFRWRVLAVTLVASLIAHPGRAADEDALAWIESVSGTVYLRTDDGQVRQLQKVEPGRPIVVRAGWLLSTDKNTRCRVNLRGGSVLPLGPSSSVRFTRKDQRVLTRLLRGVMSFFHRDEPGEFEVETPQVAAVIYGTEFVLAVETNDTTTLTLYDGRLQLADGTRYGGGNVVVFESGRPPRRTAAIRVDDLEAVQWCLYYPAVLDPREMDLEPELARQLAPSLAAYEAGDLVSALAAYPPGRAPSASAERVYYAALLLSVGQVSEAEQWLKDAAASAQARQAGALRQLIATVKLAPLSRVASSNSLPPLASEWMARSYAVQATGDLAAALEAARQATRISPAFGFAWGRVAELEFSFGRLAAANGALVEALRLSPRNAQAHALRGFVLAGQYRFQEALDAFNRALASDGSLGNAWLGRGLCRFRLGDVAGGRMDLELAAATEPQRALLRSYLGKAFFEEKRWDRAFEELRLAMEKDPRDPTAWLYAALLLQQRQRVHEAIAHLEEARRLNDNRQRYRSRLLLDQDLAVRGANLAALYLDAGLSEVALREARRAVQTDYANGSAHAFLAHAYHAWRDPRSINLRYETPWFNELLLANLLTPPGAGLLSQNVSQQEYSRLFDRDRVGWLSSTEYLSRGDWIQTASQYGQAGPASYALDVDFRDEHGQRANEDRQATSLWAKTKVQLSPQDSLLVLANTLDSRAGDLLQYYDPNRANRGFRLSESQHPNVFLGYHREWQPGSHTLLLLSRLDDSLRYVNPQAQTLLLRRMAAGNLVPYVLPAAGGTLASDPFEIRYERRYQGYSAELQQIWQSASHTAIAGSRLQIGRPSAEWRMTPPVGQIWFPATPYQDTADAHFDRIGLYLYDLWQVLPRLQLQGGLAYDRIAYPANLDAVPLRAGQRHADQVAPKLGFSWEWGTNTHLHGAWTRSLGGVYYDQSVRLEPSQWGGFNQAFRSLIPESSPAAASGLAPGARFETGGLGFDHRWGARTYVSLSGEWLREKAERELGVFEYTFPNPPTGSTTLQRMDYSELSLTATAQRLVERDWSLGWRHRLSWADLETRLPGLSNPYNYATPTPTPLETEGGAQLHEARFFTLWHHPCGVYAQFDAHWHGQSNAGAYADLLGDSFWQFDLRLGYRFWQRRAHLRLGLLNLTNRDYRLNPLNYYQELPRARTLSVQFGLAL